MGLSDVAAMKAVVGIDPDAYAAATTNGTGIDTMGYHQALVIVSAGDITTSLAVTVEESSDNGSADAFSAITGAAFTTILAAADNVVAVGRINLQGTERYIRISGVSVGATCDYGVAVVMSPYYTGDGSTFDFEV